MVKDKKIGYKMINARAETVAEKPAYRAAFKKCRCLLPASGFYEWQKTNGKQPYNIRMKDGRSFFFAGLWEHWGHEGETVESCTIIVTEANNVLESIHDRMPVILKPDEFSSWLDPATESKSLQSLLIPYPDNDMEAYPVSKAVNSPKNNGLELIRPSF